MSKPFLIVHSILLIMLSMVTILPISWPEKDDNSYSENRILVSLIETTGPHFEIIKGKEYIINKLVTMNNGKLNNRQRLNSGIIELTGNAPPGPISSPYLVDTSYIVYGKLIGISEKWKKLTSEEFPLFEVTKWATTKYVPIFEINSIMILDAVFVLYLFIQICYRIIHYSIKKHKYKRDT